MPEELLVETIVRLIEREYCSDEAIDRIRKALRRRQKARGQSAPVDLKQLQKRISILDGQIETGAERVFSAPAGIVPSLYTQLDGLRIERDRLRGQLQAAERPKEGSDDQEVQEVEEAIEALGALRKTFKESEPADLRELMHQIITKIELSFSHQRHGKKIHNEFQSGTIRLRSDKRLSFLCGTARRCLAHGRA
jgi:predicted secreted protein